MNAIRTISYKSEGPTPLLREVPKAAPYPTEALGLLRGERQRRHTTSRRRLRRWRRNQL